MSDETKPLLPGTAYGELSPEGQWFWNGTGSPDDQWIVNPDFVPEPAPLVAPTLAKSHVQTMAVMDYANQNKFTLPTLPGSLTWVYISQCWARHDIIRVAGL